MTNIHNEFREEVGKEINQLSELVHFQANIISKIIIENKAPASAYGEEELDLGISGRIIAVEALRSHEYLIGVLSDISEIINKPYDVEEYANWKN